MKACWQLANMDFYVTCHCAFLSGSVESFLSTSTKCQFWERYPVLLTNLCCHCILNRSTRILQVHIWGVFFCVWVCGSPFLLQTVLCFQGAVDIYLSRTLFSPMYYVPSALTEGVQQGCQSEISELDFAARNDDSCHDDCDAGSHYSVLRYFAAFPERCWTVFANPRSSRISCLWQTSTFEAPGESM